MFKYPGNKADVNTLNKDGLTAFHILLAQLIDLATLENKSEEARGPNPPKDEDIEVRRGFFCEGTKVVIQEVWVLTP